MEVPFLDLVKLLVTGWKTRVLRTRRGGGLRVVFDEKCFCECVQGELSCSLLSAPSAALCDLRLSMYECSCAKLS